MRTKTLKRLFGVLVLSVSSLAWAAPTVTIDSPNDGATIEADNVTVSGLATAVGGGAGIDLILVLDDSGSLSSTDPTRDRFQAVRELMNSFGPSVNIHLGMVFFTDSASVAVPLTEVSSVAAAVEQAITSHASPGGNTNITSGINEAASQFRANGRSGASQVMVVFTDGRDGSDPASAASNAAASGVTVNVVGLGSDSSYQAAMQEIATSGGGVMLAATNPDELRALFRSARFVDIQGVAVVNQTTGVSAPVVNVSAGAFTTSVDLGVGSNDIVVTATDTDGASATAQVTVTRQVIPTPAPTPTRSVKLRPQVLMAGFDPMLLNITDDQFNVVAVVREGATPISQVSLSENTSGFPVAMTYAGDLEGGDKVYTLTYSFARGSIPMNTQLPNLFGSQVGEYNITVVDAGQMRHSFPNLEYGNNPDLAVTSEASSGSSYTQAGPKRVKPQPVMVGFDPALLNFGDTSFDVKAIVREGITSIRSVTLRNGGTFAQTMQYVSTLANGDQMYKITYTFPRGSFPTGAFRDLFGEEQVSEFRVEVTDEGQQSHSFPALEMGNYPAM
ncbi:VWA domain-containing protein [Endothiovibrio diazotrophicus]